MWAALKQAGFAEVQTLQFSAATYLSGWWTGTQAETEGSLESRHSTARMCARTCAPGDEAVRLTFPIDTASRWRSVRGSDIPALLFKPKPMKISLIPPPPRVTTKRQERSRMPGSVLACSWPTGRLFFLYTLQVIGEEKRNIVTEAWDG